MPGPLFKPGVVYPSDWVGPYVELHGTVTAVSEHEEGDDAMVTVKTPEGEFDGVTPRPPKVGYSATIHVYNSGGGWYPDNRVVGWSANR
jgi:hypothetical protein